jgi:glutamine amidotransferase
MIAIIDYDAGNMKSVEKALIALGQDVVVTRDAETILNADKVILPGVGSFGDAMGKLHDYQLVEVIRQVEEKKIPFLGICLGLQLLFESSEETPGVEGLGILKGKIVKIPENGDLKVPHMGWNSLKVKEGAKLFSDLPEEPYVYFVHSYYASGCEDSLLSTSEYGIPITAAVAKDNVSGTQFHPEKSGEVGLSILRAFAEW